MGKKIVLDRVIRQLESQEKWLMSTILVNPEEKMEELKTLNDIKRYILNFDKYNSLIVKYEKTIEEGER